MRQLTRLFPVAGSGDSDLALGTPGRLAIFAGSLALVMLAPTGKMLPAAALPLVINGLLYPAALRRLLRWRWLIFIGLLVLPGLFLGGPPVYDSLGLAISLPGLMMGTQMTLRAVVVIVAVDGFSSAVDIAEVAGMLERVGLPGLGFSMGVAVNLLPALRRSGQNAWFTLRMRGGFRSQWWRGLRLLLVTIVANALRRAEEIALAAEARAFSPAQTRALPVKRGAYDWLVVVAAVAVLIVVLIVL